MSSKYLFLSTLIMNFPASSLLSLTFAYARMQSSKKRSKMHAHTTTKEIGDRQEAKGLRAMPDISNELKLFYLKFSCNHFSLK